MVVKDQDYEFDLMLADCDIDTPVLADALYEAGCDDGLVGAATPKARRLPFGAKPCPALML